MKTNKELIKTAKKILKNKENSTKKIVLSTLIIADHLGYNYLTSPEIATIAKILTNKDYNTILNQIHDIANKSRFIKKEKTGKYTKLTLNIKDNTDKEILKTELEQG